LQPAWDMTGRNLPLGAAEILRPNKKKQPNERKREVREVNTKRKGPSGLPDKGGKMGKATWYD